MLEPILQTVAIFIGAVTIISAAARIFVQARSNKLKPMSPEALKTAIEIYNSLNKSDSENQRAIVKAYIDSTIHDIYQPSAQVIKPVTKVEPVTAVESVPIEEFPLYNPTRVPNSLWEFRWYWRAIPAVMLFGFTYMTVYILRDGFSWGATITGYFALVGLFLLVAGRDYIRRFVAVPTGAGQYQARIQLRHLNEAEDLLKNSSYQQAIEQCDFIIHNFPENEGAFWYRAYAHERLGNKDDAIRDYEKFISLAKKRKYITVAQQNIKKLQQAENKVTGSSQ